MPCLRPPCSPVHPTRVLCPTGLSACVQAVCLKSGQDVVLKAYCLPSLTPFLTHQALREVAVHSGLQHPHIVQLIGAFRVSRMARIAGGNAWTERALT
jgi:hypothetical protein